VTEPRENGWKRAWRSYDRFGESLETSVKPWVVLMIVVTMATIAFELYFMLTGGLNRID